MRYCYTMKKKIFLLLGMLVLATPQCSRDDDGGQDNIDRTANLRSTGESALDFLTNATFDRLVVELAFVASVRPTDEAIDDLRDFLLERTQKTDISFEFLSVESSGELEESLQDIAQKENDNRTAYNNGSTLTLYIYFTDAIAEGDAENNESITLGAVYRNTSMVIYQRAIRALASRTTLVSREELEAATLMHEMGHLFGLVNLDPSLAASFPHNLEDPEADNHCDEEGCLMQASLEFSASAKAIMESRMAKGQQPIPDLGPECLRVLASMGGR